MQTVNIVNLIQSVAIYIGMMDVVDYSTLSLPLKPPPVPEPTGEDCQYARTSVSKWISEFWLAKMHIEIEFAEGTSLTRQN